MVDSFNQRKQDMLSKKDKSTIGGWDEKIVELCEKINSLENYYTTSSCSGRVALIKDIEGERGDLFVKVWHDEISLEDLSGIGEKEVKFKQESPIIHVCCKDLENAESLLEKAREIGWKRSGIISTGKGFICELVSTEKIEFPFIKDGKVLVDDEFLKVVVEKANNNLKKGWDKIRRLKESIK
jgi:tRNA wybutosine-synthesizing protein 3